MLTVYLLYFFKDFFINFGGGPLILNVVLHQNKQNNVKIIHPPMDPSQEACTSDQCHLIYGPGLSFVDVAHGTPSTEMATE